MNRQQKVLDDLRTATENATQYVNQISAVIELVNASENACQYVAKLSADREGDFIGRCAHGGLRRLRIAIENVQAVCEI